MAMAISAPAILPTIEPRLRVPPPVPVVPVWDDLRRGGDMLMPLFNSESGALSRGQIPPGRGGERPPLFMTAAWSMIALSPNRTRGASVMSIFGDIISAIFGSSAKAETPAAGTQAPAAKPAAASPSGGPAATIAPSGSTGPSAPAAKASAPARHSDVAAELDGLAKHSKQKLNSRTSIVDLMKLLDLDSSQAARKKLAEELHYTGDTKNSAKMNVWLHKQVMIKLAANGGKVPDEL